jgi:phosphoribosylanthranilate isomerase
MWIKICGNTNVEDARLAAELGADAVGFVFAESPRQVTAAQVAAIVPMLPDSVEKIGVFSSRDAEEIAGVVRETGLTGIQLHGDLDIGLARRLRTEFSGQIPIVVTLHWALDAETNNAEEMSAELDVIAGDSSVRHVLIDSRKGAAIGGTGLTFDWNSARSVLHADRLEHGMKLIVAGGLRPENVAEAVRALSPWGVDVASGVEASKGRKNPLKLKEFIEAAREF